MAAHHSNYKEQLLCEIKEPSEEYLPGLLVIV